MSFRAVNTILFSLVRLLRWLSAIAFTWHSLQRDFNNSGVGNFDIFWNGSIRQNGNAESTCTNPCKLNRLRKFFKLIMFALGPTITVLRASTDFGDALNTPREIYDDFGPYEALRVQENGKEQDYLSHIFSRLLNRPKAGSGTKERKRSRETPMSRIRWKGFRGG